VPPSLLYEIKPHAGRNKGEGRGKGGLVRPFGRGKKRRNKKRLLRIVSQPEERP